MVMGEDESLDGEHTRNIQMMYSRTLYLKLML